MDPFWQPFLLVLVAEISDKTQLVTLAFAARFGVRVVLAGVLVATLLINLVSTAAGELLGLALPAFWLGIVAGLAFCGFGLWMLRGEAESDEGDMPARRFGPFVTVAATFFVAELGDKTMLTTITLASQLRVFLPVWLGASLGMMAANGVAITVGALAGHSMPERHLRYAASAIFVGTGLFTLVATFLTL